MRAISLFVIIWGAGGATAGAKAAAETVVTSDVYENLVTDRDGKDVPVTFSRVGAVGHFTRGVTPVVDGVKLPAQVDVLRKAPDGSIRHALVSFILPALPAGGKMHIDWLNESPPESPAFRWGFTPERLSPKLLLTTEAGKVLISDAGPILAGKWAASERVKVIHDGPVMKELEVHDVFVDVDGRNDPELDVYWRLRAFTGDRFYAEELSFWASFQMGEWPHRGLNWQGLDRAFAWSLRQVTDAAWILPETDSLQPYFVAGINKCLDEMTEKLVKSGRRVHSPPEGGWKVSGRYNWVNATQCSSWQYAWVVWSLGNAADKGFDKARSGRDWAAEYIVGLYTSADEFTAPDGKVYRYDSKDAMPYSTAIQLLETRLETKDGQKDIRVVRKVRDLDNYGEIWYYTKLNEDNAWSRATGGPPEPDAQGRKSTVMVGSAFLMMRARRAHLHGE